MKFSHRQHERKQQTIKSTLVVDRQVQTGFIPAITMPRSQVSCLWFSQDGGNQPLRCSGVVRHDLANINES